MKVNPVTIEQMQAADWDTVRTIYLDGIATGQATFETAAPSFESWDAAHLPFSRLVARQAETIVGWAALSAISKREVYRGVAEVSAYVSPSRGSAGIGRKLLTALIQESEQNGIWTLQA